MKAVTSKDACLLCYARVEVCRKATAAVAAIAAAVHAPTPPLPFFDGDSVNLERLPLVSAPSALALYISVAKLLPGLVRILLRRRLLLAQVSVQC